jgi:hypothetical protein
MNSSFSLVSSRTDLAFCAAQKNRFRCTPLYADLVLLSLYLYLAVTRTIFFIWTFQFTLTLPRNCSQMTNPPLPSFKITHTHRFLLCVYIQTFLSFLFHFLACHVRCADILAGLPVSAASKCPIQASKSASHIALRERKNHSIPLHQTKSLRSISQMDSLFLCYRS